MNQLLVEQQARDKAEITGIVKELHDLTISINHEKLSLTLSDLRERINDPFMFVVVGEVKAGKSSFINALLEQDVCGVAPQPLTDTIQQISYGEEEASETINTYFKKLKMPIEILKDIAIVDTPGTNAIIAHHQELTERFIPSSDLIVFVFEAKNPYRQSSWEFFNFIQEEWRKKIIFVLQQKDLLPEDDLEVNYKGVRDYAIKKGIENPEVFSVSAKMEIEGEHEGSGFRDVRSYIKDKITGGGAAKLKLESNINIASNISGRINSAVGLRKNQYLSDVEFRSNIKKTLEEQEKKSLNKVERLINNLLAGYDQVCYKTEDKIRSELGFFSVLKRSFSSMFSKKQSLKDWFNNVGEVFSNDINTTLQQKLNDGIFDVADSVNQMLTTIDHKIKASETILKSDEQFFSDISEKRNTILKDLKSAFQNFIEDTDNFRGASAFGENQSMAPNLAKGGGIAVIGIVLSTLTNVMVFDITGGILSAVGLLFAGVSLGLNKSKVIKGFKEETSTGRIKLKTKITEKLNLYIKDLSTKIDSNFTNFDKMIAKEKLVVEELESKIFSIDKRLHNISTK